MKQEFTPQTYSLCTGRIERQKKSIWDSCSPGTAHRYFVPRMIMRQENLKSLMNWQVQSPVSPSLTLLTVWKTSHNHISTRFVAMTRGQSFEELRSHQHSDWRWATLIKGRSIPRPSADISWCLTSRRDHMHINRARLFLLNNPRRWR